MMNNIHDENDLLRALSQRQDNAVEHFYLQYVDELYAYAISIGGNRETIKDVIQDVFIKLYTSPLEFESVNHLKFFLLKSVKNRMYDIYKSAGYNRELAVEEFSFEMEVVPSVLNKILNQEEQKILELKVNKMLSVLTPRQRTAIYLRYIQELDYTKIAELMDLNVHGVRKLVSRALQLLRKSNLSIPFLILLKVYFSSASPIR